MRLCTFTVGRHQLGVDAHRVREIVALRELTAVAGAPRHVRGLVNLRGQIVTCLDLATLLGLEPAVATPPLAVVIEHDDELVSVGVDRVADVVELDPADVEPLPATVARALAGNLTGACQRPDHLLLLLDLTRVLSVDQPPVSP